MFLLPFVAIRVVSGDRQSGALKLELQHAMPLATRVAAKVFVILAGWLVTYAAGLMAIVLWRGYGGSVYRAGDSWSSRSGTRSTPRLRSRSRWPWPR